MTVSDLSTMPEDQFRLKLGRALDYLAKNRKMFNPHDRKIIHEAARRYLNGGNNGSDDHPHKVRA